MLAILCLFSFKMDIWNLLEQSLDQFEIRISPYLVYGRLDKILM